MSLQKRIHNRIKKHAPHAARKAKKLFSFKYPKIFFMILLIFLAYYFFQNPEVLGLIQRLDKLSYFGIFIAGMFLALGFSAPFSIGFLMLSNPGNIVLATVIGGAGAALGDLLIFKMIKFSFMNELEKLKKTILIKDIKKFFYSRSILARHYLLYAFAGIVLVTPLPDEIGVSMLAGLTTIKLSKLIILSFVLHSIAILFILWLGMVL